MRTLRVLAAVTCENTLRATVSCQSRFQATFLESCAERGSEWQADDSLASPRRRRNPGLRLIGSSYAPLVGEGQYRGHHERNRPRRRGSEGQSRRYPKSVAGIGFWSSGRYRSCACQPLSREGTGRTGGLDRLSRNTSGDSCCQLGRGQNCARGYTQTPATLTASCGVVVGD